jgi:hypothetical protein
MRIHQEQFEHPTQASALILNVYEQDVPADNPAAEEVTRGRKGYLVTEDRVGSSRVVTTLGFYESREEAMDAVSGRVRQLALQRWRAVGSAA